MAMFVIRKRLANKQMNVRGSSLFKLGLRCPLKWNQVFLSVLHRSWWGMEGFRYVRRLVYKIAISKMGVSKMGVSEIGAESYKRSFDSLWTVFSYITKIFLTNLPGAKRNGRKVSLFLVHEMISYKSHGVAQAAGRAKLIAVRHILLTKERLTIKTLWNIMGANHAFYSVYHPAIAEECIEKRIVGKWFSAKIVRRGVSYSGSCQTLIPWDRAYT